MITFLKNLAKPFTEGDVKFNALVATVWGGLLFKYLSGFLSHFSPVLSDLFYPVFVGILVLIDFRSIFKKLSAKDYVFFFACLLIYISNYLFYPDTAEYLSAYFVIVIFSAVPYYFFGKILDIVKYTPLLYSVSVLCVISCALYNLSYAAGNLQEDYSDGLEVYNMVAAYNLLPHVLFVSFCALKQFNIWASIFMIIGVFLEFAFGTRGPVVCTLTFILTYLFFFKKYKHGFVFRLALITLFVGLVMVLDAILISLQGVITMAGMSTRIIDRYFDETINVSVGRETMQGQLLNLMSSTARVFGHGLFGSYTYVRGYSHNIFIDFFFSYGYLLALLLWAFLVIIISKRIIYSKDNNIRGFVLVLICASIIKLTMTGSYLFEPYFFLLIGFCCQSKSNKILYNESFVDNWRTSIS